MTPRNLNPANMRRLRIPCRVRCRKVGPMTQTPMILNPENLRRLCIPRRVRCRKVDQMTPIIVNPEDLRRRRLRHAERTTLKDAEPT